MSSWASIQAGDASTGLINADEMILLTDGSVLIHNANTSQTTVASASAAQWLRLTPDDQGNYDTANVTWSTPGAMSTARQYFGSGVLRDGRVFVIGGEYSSDTADTQGTGVDSPLGETFDPVTNQWTQLPKPATFSFIQGDVPACVLPDGRVLVGGITNPPQTAIWDPVYDTWTVAGTGGAKAANPDEETWTLLPDGSVLTVDVFSVPAGSAERYVPANDAWVPAGSPPDNLVLQQIVSPQFGVVASNEIGPAVLLPNGTVFAIGATGQTALYNPTAANPWAAGPSFPPDTSGSNLSPTLTAIDAPACLLPNGKVVCVAGQTTVIPPNPPNLATCWSNNLQFFEFDPLNPVSPIPLLGKQPGTAANPWPGAGTFTYQCWFLLLPTGQLLCSAGQNYLYLYTPDGSPQPGWAPTITSVPASIVTGGTFTIAGTQLSGLSQAVSYGDDGQMATNYPLVQVTSNATARFLRTFNFSSMGVAAAGAISADVEVPCGLPAGQWDLVVIANGIPSAKVPIEVVERSTQNPFDIPTVAPAGHFGGWANTGGDAADDLGDSVSIGMHNYITDPSHPAQDSNATQVQNVAEDNACFIAQNQSKGDGVVGIFGESDGCRGSIGVAGSALGWGVAGAATSQPADVLNNGNAAGFTPFPSNVGVFGVGDNFGVYGQNRAAENQRATSLPAPGNVGVYGVGDAAGVQGDSDHIDITNGTDIGTGVVGTSTQGIGVLGQGTGGSVSTEAIPPYIGVHGLSQAHPALPFPPRQEYLATGVLGVGDMTGVFGVGDIRGGVFKTSANPAAQTFANVQLIPVRLRTDKLPNPVYTPATELPVLPALGMPGDIVAVETIDAHDEETVELWICIRPPAPVAGKVGPRATWARISFNNVVPGGG